MASNNITKINTDIISHYQFSFENEKSNYNNAYNLYNSSYLNTCSDSYIVNINRKIKALYDVLNKDYNIINNWWIGYINGTLDLEKTIINNIDLINNNHGSFVTLSNQNNNTRYLAYKNLHPELADETIMLYISMGIDKAFYSEIKPATNLNTSMVLVNKCNQLPSDYIPNGLVKIDSKFATKDIKLQEDAKDAFVDMCQAAKKDKYAIKAASGYRSYEYQENLYNNYVKKDGIEKADTYSARPGFSEHQTGLAVDVTKTGGNYEDFGNSKEFKWMQENSYKYGFILRYPENKSYITGYNYEAWHYRYVGQNIATYIHKAGITYDEYYALFLSNLKPI